MAELFPGSGGAKSFLFTFDRPSKERAAMAANEAPTEGISQAVEKHGFTFGSIIAPGGDQSHEKGNNFIGNFGPSSRPRDAITFGQSGLFSGLPSVSCDTSPALDTQKEGTSSDDADSGNPFSFSGLSGGRIPVVKPSASVSSPKASDIRIAAEKAVNIGTDILTISVGNGDIDDSQTFTIHKNLIASRSEHIRGVLETDPTVKNVHMHDVDLGATVLYIQLLYFGHLPSKDEQTDRLGDFDMEFSLLCKLYILALELKDIETRNVAVDAIFAKAQVDQGRVPGEAIWNLYNGTPGPCAARKLMVDIYKCKANSSWMEGQTLPPAFMEDLAMSFVAGAGVLFKGTMAKDGVAMYHEE